MLFLLKQVDKSTLLIASLVILNIHSIFVAPYGCDGTGAPEWIDRLSSRGEDPSTLLERVEALEQKVLVLEAKTSCLDSVTDDTLDVRCNMHVSGYNLVVHSDGRSQSGNVIIGDPTEVVRGEYGQDSLVVGVNHDFSGSIGSVIAGGHSHSVSASYAAVMGGSDHILTADYAVAVGGEGNTVGDASHSIVNEAAAKSLALGGKQNTVTGEHSVIVGGQSNEAIGPMSVTVGGLGNKAWGDHSLAAGGESNRAGTGTVSNGVPTPDDNGHKSVAIGGHLGEALGDLSVAVGGEASSASHPGAVCVGGATSGVASGVHLGKKDIPVLVDHLSSSILMSDGLLSWNIIDGVPSLVLDGANLLVRNGLGGTATTNGAGNVIVGYNEQRDVAVDRAGSHSVIVGSGHSYSGYANLVHGHNNTASGDRIAIVGTWESTVTRSQNTILGGWQHRIVDASGAANVVVGGFKHTVGRGIQNVVVGGQGSTMGRNDTVEAAAHHPESVSIFGGIGCTVLGETVTSKLPDRESCPA